MVVLLETETTSGFFQNIVHVSTCGSREEASMVPVGSGGRDVETERTTRGGLLLTCQLTASSEMGREMGPARGKAGASPWQATAKEKLLG